ncbi:MAG: hypothetical protein IT376_02180 [Polyangiaceae bacterium]|nr:hypothetical protein [Polyangiaceae bacterium]
MSAIGRCVARRGGLGLAWCWVIAATAARGEPSPPPSSSHFVQYGVALAAETPVDAGAACPERATAPCILGAGSGLTIRAGYRARAPWYVGGAYELTRQNSSNLLRLAILQQLRAETRYYPVEGWRAAPYLWAGGGPFVYGNEWGVETGGLVSTVGVGLELELSRSTLLGVGAGYRLLVLRGWTDDAGQRRADALLGFGAAHFAGLELGFELRDPLSRW